MTKRTEISCYDRALGFLARRQHFEVELRRKLGRAHAEDEIDETIERLREEGLVDDAACARAFCEGPLRRKGYGPNRVRHDLMRRGASPEIAEQASRESFPHGDLEVAEEAAERWRARRFDGEPDRAGLARHLERKGFTAGSIRAIVRSEG